MRELIEIARRKAATARSGSDSANALKDSRVQFERFEDRFTPLFKETDVGKGEP